jgi:hypothetical protein
MADIEFGLAADMEPSGGTECTVFNGCIIPVIVNTGCEPGYPPDIFQVTVENTVIRAAIDGNSVTPGMGNVGIPDLVIITLDIDPAKILKVSCVSPVHVKPAQVLQIAVIN